ncbi:PrgI family protein [Candidatus Roizmanbacteria bacterium]|nr:PrgI family protein [Candidatus Roizmanbacteria bacterium]
MEQHPIPRQITTFEFKLIGFLTLRQFLYLVVFVPLGFIMYKVFPVPVVNIVLGVGVGAIGLAFAFIPINDRPLEVWIRNFIKRLTSPTQYLYQKENKPLYFLKDLFFAADPHRVMAHIESQEKLAGYLASRRTTTTTSVRKQTINNLLQGPAQKQAVDVVEATPQMQTVVVEGSPPTASQAFLQKQPFFTGEVKNHKLIPIPGILIYVKDQKGEVKRLLKTNPHGVFATFSPLPVGEYSFEIKDPKNVYFFDTMKIRVDVANPRPLEFNSKELL